jgi:hypothetical protein
MRNEKETAERLQKYTTALNEMNNKVKSSIYNSASLKSICSKYKINLALMSYAIRIGLFEKVERGVYISKYNIIEPYQTRKIMNEIAKDNREYMRKNAKKSKYTLAIPTPTAFSENEAISYLKRLGYKIMKPVQQFEEI